MGFVSNVLSHGGGRTLPRQCAAKHKGNLMIASDRIARLACLGETSAEIVHEIANALTGITGRIEMLDMAATDAERRKILEELLCATRSFSDHARRILGFAKGAQARRELRDLRQILSHAVESRSKSLACDRINVSLECPNERIEVLADEFRLQQVFNNLITNAHHELLNVRRRRLVIRVKRIDGGAIVEIEDSGRGIPKRWEKRIFKPFVTTKPDGTGLGLSISLRIAREHGGRLRLDRNSGCGARFVLELPLAESATRPLRQSAKTDKGH